MSRGRESQDRYDEAWLIGALTQLQVRYPAYIRRLRRGELSVDIGFYIEDLAMACTQWLLDEGITAIHRLDHPRTISLQIPSLNVQDQIYKAHAVLASFLKRASEGSDIYSSRYVED